MSLQHAATMTLASQFTRYAVIGVISNAVIYTLYLVATGLGAAPTAAMSVLYVIGVLQSFFFNRRWTFRSAAPGSRILLRYGIVYASGYLINYAVLAFSIEELHLPHQYVQAAMIFILAAYLFTLQRLWVFETS